MKILSPNSLEAQNIIWKKNNIILEEYLSLISSNKFKKLNDAEQILATNKILQKFIK